MKVVVDVGCARYGGDYSIEHLIEEFHPDVIYGFDPNQGQDEYPREAHAPGGPTGPTIATRVLIEKKAAWTFDGEVRFLEDGLSGKVGDYDHWPFVPCIDLARFIRELPEDDEVILKIDAEGSEYPLLEHLIATGVDERLELLWVEWHMFGVVNPTRRRRSLEKRLRCPVEVWRW